MGDDQAKPSPQLIVACFMKQYYERLIKNSPDLISYYSEQSYWLHEDRTDTQGSGSDALPQQGRQAVAQGFGKSNYVDSRVVVHSVHSQPSINGSILVLAIGSLFPLEGGERSFAHSFLLARGTTEKSYFLMNDILRFTDRDVVKESIGDAEGTEAAHAAVQPQDEDEDVDEPGQAVSNVEPEAEAEPESTGWETAAPVQESLPQHHDAHFDRVDHQSVDHQAPLHSLDENTSTQGQSTVVQPASVPTEPRAPSVAEVKKTPAAQQPSSSQQKKTWSNLLKNTPPNVGSNLQGQAVSTVTHQTTARAPSTAKPAAHTEKPNLFLPIPCNKFDTKQLEAAFASRLGCACTILSVDSRGPSAMVVTLNDPKQANLLIEGGSVSVAESTIPCRPLRSGAHPYNDRQGHGRGRGYRGGRGGRGGAY